MRRLVLLALLALAACNEVEPPPSCHGDIFPLNTGRWNPTPADLGTPAQIGRGG